MALFVASDQAAAAYVPPQRPAALPEQTPAGYVPRLIALQQARSSGLLLSAIFTLIGVSLGTITGIGLAMATEPAQAKPVFVSTASSSSPAAALPAHLQTVSAPAPQRQAAVPAHVAPTAEAPHAVPRPAKLHRHATTHAAPAHLRASSFSIHRHKSHVYKYFIHYAIPPQQAGTAIVSTVDSPVNAHAPNNIADGLGGQQREMGAAARSARISVEGDLQVVDYDASAGTIQTIDGRVFSIGATQSAPQAASWDDYRADVHYRCGPDGGCVLTRAGVVAPFARLI